MTTGEFWICGRNIDFNRTSAYQGPDGEFTQVTLLYQEASFHTARIGIVRSHEKTRAGRATPSTSTTSSLVVPSGRVLAVRVLSLMLCTELMATRQLPQIMASTQGYDFGLDNIEKLVKIIFDEDVIVTNENARALFIRCRDVFGREKVAALDAYQDSYRSPWLPPEEIRRAVAAGIPCEPFGDPTHFVTCLATAIRFVTHQTWQHNATTWNDETVVDLGSQNSWANAIVVLALELEDWDGNEEYLSSIQQRLFQGCKDDPLDKRVVLESVILDYQLLKGYTVHDRGFCNFCFASSELGLPANGLAINPTSDQIGWWSTIFQDYFGARENSRRMKCPKGHTFNYVTHTVQGNLPEHLFSTPEARVPGRFSTPHSVLFNYTSNRNCIDFACYNWLGTLVEEHDGSHCLYWRHEEKEKIFKLSPSESHKFFEIPIGERDVNDAIPLSQHSTETLVIFE